MGVIQEDPINRWHFRIVYSLFVLLTAAFFVSVYYGTQEIQTLRKEVDQLSFRCGSSYHTRQETQDTDGEERLRSLELILQRQQERYEQDR